MNGQMSTQTEQQHADMMLLTLADEGNVSYIPLLLLIIATHTSRGERAEIFTGYKMQGRNRSG